MVSCLLTPYWSFVLFLRNMMRCLSTPYWSFVPEELIRTFTSYGSSVTFSLFLVSLQVFRGNSDRNSIVSHHLRPAIIARFIRIQPRTWHAHISLRVGFYGRRPGESDGKAVLLVLPVWLPHLRYTYPTSKNENSQLWHVITEWIL